MTEPGLPDLGSRYVLVRRLDEGGMATIYLGVDTQLDGREVAIKLLKYTSGDGAEQIWNEVQIMLRLRHPHIITILDAGKSRTGQPFIVMELLRGKNLASYLADLPQGRLSLIQGLDYARQLCQALAHAHAQNVYHGDISARNVYVCDSGKLKLLDLGTSRVREATMTMTPELRAQIAVTLAYAAPELFGGSLRISDRLRDIYSFGVVLYEMFTGQRPFQGRPDHVLIARIVHASPVPPRQHVRELPRALQRLILTALARDPKERYASFEALQADLDRVREGPTRTELALIASATVGLLIVGFIAGRVNAADPGDAPAGVVPPASSQPATVVPPASPQPAVARESVGSEPGPASFTTGLAGDEPGTKEPAEGEPGRAGVAKEPAEGESGRAGVAKESAEGELGPAGPAGSSGSVVKPADKSAAGKAKKGSPQTNFQAAMLDVARGKDLLTVCRLNKSANSRVLRLNVSFLSTGKCTLTSGSFTDAHGKETVSIGRSALDRLASKLCQTSYLNPPKKLVVEFDLTQL